MGADGDSVSAGGQGNGPTMLVAPFREPEAQMAQKVWSKHLGQPVVIINRWKQSFRLIPPGEFTRGTSPDNAEALRKFDSKINDGSLSDESVASRVRITNPVWFGEHLVTVGQFRTFANLTAYQTEAERFGDRQTWKQPGIDQKDDHPVVCVSDNDCEKYLAWLNSEDGDHEYRLPTEAEWEYAARAGTNTLHYRGDDLNELPKLANISSLRRGTSPVGDYPANPFGLFDMLGNTWEWCSDWYAPDYYKRSPTEDPPGASSGVTKVLRGGAWNESPRNARCGYRSHASRGLRGAYIGLRLVLTPRKPVRTALNASPSTGDTVNSQAGGTGVQTVAWGKPTSTGSPANPPGMPKPVLYLPCDSIPAGLSFRRTEGRYVPGKVGQGVSYEINQYSELEIALPVGAQRRTLALWARDDRGPIKGSRFHTITYGPIGQGTPFGIMVAEGNWRMFDNNGGLDSNITVDRNWHHHAVSYDGTTIRYYFDGTMTAQTDRTLKTASGVLAMGGLGNPSINFVGVLDEIYVFDVPLHASQIQTLRRFGESPN